MRLILALILTFSVLGVPGAAAADSGVEKPVWQISLKIPDYPSENGLRPWVRPAVTFIDPDEVVVAYASPARNAPPGTWELEVFVLGEQDGRVQLHKTFPMSGRSAGLFRSKLGKLIIWLGDKLIVLLPKTFEREKSRELRGGVEPYSDGQHVVLVNWNGYTVKTGPGSGYVHDSTDTVSFVRLDTLETEATCEVDGLDIPKAVMGDLAVNTVTAAGGRRAVYLGNFCDAWKRISDLQGGVSFLSIDKLVVADYPDLERPHVTLLTTGGNQVCSVDLAKYSGSLDAAKPSSDGRRLALEIHDLRGSEKPTLDMYRHFSRTHISVYGPKSDSCLALLLDVGTTKRPRWPFDFALSSDGSRLAVLGDGRVRMFRVP